MSDTFLPNFMRVAYDIIKAERAFAVDSRLNVLATVNMQPEEVEVSYLKGIKKAVEEGQPVTTDSVTLTIDPAQAPKTNQSFPQLRVVIFIPVHPYGAVCLDWRMRREVVAKEKIDRLMTLGQQMAEAQQTNLSEDQMVKLYKQIN